MSRPSVDARRTVAATPTDEAWPEEEYTTPGAVFIDPARVYKGHLLFACPGCGRMGSIRVGHPKPDNRDGGTWDLVAGDVLKPETLTLAPSIHCVGCCRWHGFLQGGVFKSC